MAVRSSVASAAVVVLALAAAAKIAACRCAQDVSPFMVDTAVGN
jgi:hypothetical protein